MTSPKIPKPAATVLVVRQGPRGPQVFMVKRPGRGDFPDLHVFPGGKVDPEDANLEEVCIGIDEIQASRELSVDRGGLQYWVTAIRECFEEAGVFLAYRDEAMLGYGDDAEWDRFDAHREALIAGSLPMADLLAREQLTLATDQMLYFSHWITPEMAPARFDVRFFITTMPPDQDARSHARETVAADWVEPETALAHFDAGRWQMIYPTLTTLRSIAGFDDVESLLEVVRAREHLGEITAERHRQGMQFS